MIINSKNINNIIKKGTFFIFYFLVYIFFRIFAQFFDGSFKERLFHKRNETTFKR